MLTSGLRISRSGMRLCDRGFLEASSSLHSLVRSSNGQLDEALLLLGDLAPGSRI